MSLVRVAAMQTVVATVSRSPTGKWRFDMSQDDHVVHSASFDGKGEIASDIPQLRVGDKLGDRYGVLAHLGSGGMGEVYQVEHVVLGRHFAAKVLRRELSKQPMLVARFSSEVRAMARLRSDHVAQIVDVGNLEDGTPYFVMELLKGVDLKTLLKREGALLPRRAVGLMIDACWGLNAVHAAGLVHRDIKPSNLFVVDTDSGAERCLLLDFGVTKSSSTAHTRVGQLVGTPQYMAPEQLDEGTVDVRTDLYAMGAVLYECLVGHAPHQGETLARIVSSIVNKDPIAVHTLRPAISADLSQLVQLALSRARSSRFASASAMARALSRYSESTVASARRSDESTAASLWTLPVVGVRSSSRGSWKTAWFVVLGLLGVVLGWIVWATMKPKSTAESHAFGAPPAASSSNETKADRAPSGTPTDADATWTPSATPSVADGLPRKVAPKPAATANNSSARRLKPSVSVIDATNPYAN